MDIDLIIPMVFPADPLWQQDYARNSRNADAAVKNVRWRSWDTEELLVRCCRRFMPWVRTIHLLLARESQVREWMKPLMADDPGIVVHYHRDFMPDRVLPCFNVLTIEMFLHRIPGLSEHFIYSNDDFFPLSPLQPEDFFRDGLPCQKFHEETYPSNPNTFQRFVKNGLDMVAADFGRTFRRTWLRGGHSMQPMLLSTVRKVCELHDDRISRSFTVDRTDKNFNQYIYPFYQHLSGRYVEHEPPQRYAGPRTPNASLAAIIRDPAAGIVCLNDNSCIRDWEYRAALVRREIAAKLDAAAALDGSSRTV